MTLQELRETVENMQIRVTLTEKGANAFNKLNKGAVDFCASVGIPTAKYDKVKAGDQEEFSAAFGYNMEKVYGQDLWDDQVEVL